MIRMRMLLVSSTLALAALLLPARSAHADTFGQTTGYPCSMGGGWTNTGINGVGATGPNGYAYVSLTSQPNCAGSYQGTVTRASAERSSTGSSSRPTRPRKCTRSVTP